MNSPKDLANYLKEYFLSKIGNNTISGHIFVDVGDAYDLGSASKPLRAVYATTLSGGSGSGTDELVATQSGDTPGYLDDVLTFGANFNKSVSSGVMSVNLIKNPLWADGTNALTGNLSVNSGITIDGVDLSVFKTDYDAHIINPDAHHAKLHSIIDAAHHTATGAQYSVVGLSGTNTLGILSTTSDGATNSNTILRSSGTGGIKLDYLTTELINSTSDLSLNPDSDIVFDPTSGRVKLLSDKFIELGSVGFASGFAGYGGRIEYNIARTGKSTITIDDLYVRGRLNVYELIIQQIRATNGNVFVSDSAKIDIVSFVSGSTYELTVDGDTNDYQPFAVNDIIRAQRVNLGSGIEVWQSDLQVTSISISGNAKKFRATLVSGDVPAAGMEFVRLGNNSDSSRQGTIYLAASDAYAPFIDIIDGVTSHATFGSSGTIKVRLGKLSGISDAAFTMSGYGLYSTNAYLKGVVSAANDIVRLDSSGVTVKIGSAADYDSFSDVNSYSFLDSATSFVPGGLYSGKDGVAYATILRATGTSTLPNNLILYSEGGSSSMGGRVFIIGSDGINDHTAGIELNSSAGLASPYILMYTSSGGYIQANNTFKFGVAPTPVVDLGTDIGTPSMRFGTVYADQIVSTTISGTTMSGAEWQYSGDMVIDANGSIDTTVSIVNQGSGSANLSVEKSLTVGLDIIVGGTVDGVDVSVLSSSFSSHTSNIDAHHNRDHELANSSGLGATHTVSGLTSGHVLKATSSTTAAFGQLSHASLGNLTSSDDHTQYVHNTIARTISAIHTFNPSTATPWIILGANASGQLIAGLNADLLDGYNSSDFPRKSENASISGSWTFAATIEIGTGAKIDFFDEHADKLVFYSNTYGIGTESDYVTIWSPSSFRFRSGGTGVTSGTSVFEISNTGAIISGSDTDITSVLGRGKIGYLTGVADEFSLSHIDFGTASTYMIKQTSTGNVMLNGVTGGYVDIRNNNASKLKVDDTNTVISTNVGIGMTPTVALDVTGSIKSTGSVSFNFDTNTSNYIGKAKIGYVGHSNAAAFGYHTADNTSYAFRQGAGLSTYFNAGAAQWLYYRIGDVDHMILKPAGLVLSASKSFTSATFDSTTPISGFSLNEIASNKYGFTIGSLTADQLRVRTLVADETRIDRGDEWWGKGYGIVQTEWTTPSTIGGNGVEVWFENAPSIVGAIFSDGDWIFIRLIDDSSGLEIYDIWGQVYSASSGGVGGYLIETSPTYSVNRQRWRFVLRSGEVSYSVPSGITAVNFGSTGQAFINLSTVDTAGAPYIKMGRWSGSDPYSPSNRATEVIIGKLSSVSGPTGSVGIYSKYNNSSFELSDAGALFKSIPIQSWNGANQTFNLSSSGTDLWIGVSSGDKRLTWNGSTLAITGTVTAIDGEIGGWTIASQALTSTQMQIHAGNSKIWIGASSTFGSQGIQLERNGGTPRFYVGNGSTNYIKFGGSVLEWAAANTSLDASGNLTATNASLSGNITATSGTIGGWTVITPTISSTNISLTAGVANTANILVGTGSNAGGLNSANASGDIAIWAGSTHANRGTASFRVTAGGALTATSATITGAITASSGSLSGFLTIGASGGIYQGTGTSSSPTTGLKLWNDSGVGRIAGYNSGSLQWYGGTDGKFYFGGGNVVIDSTGVSFPQSASVYMRHGVGSEETVRYSANVDSGFVGSGTYSILTRPTTVSNGWEYARADIVATNNTWTNKAKLSVFYGADGRAHTQSVGRMFIGEDMAHVAGGSPPIYEPINNISQLVVYQGYAGSSISLNHANWGRSASVAFNAYRTQQSAAYDADNEWKFLGTQDGSTRAGMLVFDGNAGKYRFYVSGNSPSQESSITGWAKALEVGFTGGNAAIGFLGASAITKPSAYTQTYSTATRTHSNLTSSALTDSTGGTANTTLEAVGATYSQSVVRNNFADLAAQVNALRNDIINLKGIVNSMIDDMQLYGLFQ